MKHLLTVWEEVKQDIQTRYLVLFLDYDGTLTPIVARPSMAKLPVLQKKVIEELSQLTGVKVVVISGRALQDVKKCMGIPGIIYAGNHGLELDGPKFKHVHPAAIEFKGLAKELGDRLRAAYVFMPEILIESKTFGISVHYRQVPEDKVEFAKLILLKEIGVYLGKSQLVLTEGKKVWEIRPPTEWSKGKTVLWLYARVLAAKSGRALPIYLGDDLTDEDAFKALKHQGLTVNIADDPSHVSEAQYFLRSPSEVFLFMKRLIEVRKKTRMGN